MMRLTVYWAICICKRDYPASLELRKIYRLVPDDAAAANKQKLRKARVSEKPESMSLGRAVCPEKRKGHVHGNVAFVI